MQIARFIFRRFYLIYLVGSKHFFRNLFSSIGLFLSLLIVVTILGIIEPMKNLMKSKMQDSIPAQTVRLVSDLAQMSNAQNPWEFFRKERDIQMPISPATLKKIQSWAQNPADFKRMYATQLLQQPVLAKFEDTILSTLGFSFDVVLQGVPFEMVSSLLKCNLPYKKNAYQDKNGKFIDEVPVVVPETYLEIFYAYAMINGLPNVKSSTLMGKRLRITLGANIMGTQYKNSEDAILTICGFAPAGVISTLGVPLDWVQAKHLGRNQRNALNSFDQIFVETANDKVASYLRKKAVHANLRVSEEKQKYNNFYKTLDKLDGIFIGIALVLALLALISLANSFALLAVQNRYEFGLYLVFGASLPFLYFLLAIEGALWGFLHSSLAIFLSGQLLPILQSHAHDIPWLMKTTGSEIAQLHLTLTPSNQASIYFITIICSAMASLIPGMLILGKRTINLVKKD